MNNFYHSGRVAAMKTVLVLGLASGLVSCAGVDQQIEPESTVSAVAVLAEGWNEFNPGGETICTDGSAYKFFVRPGANSDLLFYLQGGGACWSREHCDPNLEPTMSINTEGLDPGSFGGIFDFENSENPFKDYTVVFVPYCSGDSHLGARDTVYGPVEEGGESLTVYHRGFANVGSALNWTYHNLPSPARIFVTGSSAGSIPSPYYADKLANHYGAAKIVQLGDASGGYRRVAGGTQPEAMWGSVEYLARQKGWEDIDPLTFNFEQIYIRASQNHPEIMFSSYDTAEDNVQKSFLDLIGGQDTSHLQVLIDKNQQDIRASVKNFRSYVIAGDLHTVLLRSEFYTYTLDNHSVRDWVTALSNSAEVHDVHCGSCVVSAAAAE